MSKDVFLYIAAKILKGRKIDPKIRMIVTPASQSIYKQALQNGLIDVFIDAEAVVTNPTCGACGGLHLGVLGAGEKCISSQNRNFKARMGAIFFRNSINLGLTALSIEGVSAIFNEGDEAEINLSTGEVKNQNTGLTVRADPIPEELMNILKAGGIIPFLREEARSGQLYKP